MKLLQTLSSIAMGATLCACLSLPAIAQTETPIQKKLIGSGWDQPSTASLRKNIAQIEKSPFDGVMIEAFGKDDAGKSLRLFHYGLSSSPLKKEWFQSCVDDLKAVHSKKLANSFIIIGAMPGDVDWFDDAAWKEVVNHWRIVAWIAKEGGLKGICFDPEQYNSHPFQYAEQRARHKSTFAEYQKKVRQRGQEIIQAVAAVDPNLTIFTYWMNSSNEPAAKANNPAKVLQTAYDGLYPSFINGWLDAAPPTMIFVDGAEQAYHFNSQFDYLNAANMMRNTVLNLVAPENRAKYLSQVQNSYGFYLDAYINPPSSPWYIDPKESTPTQRLQINTKDALNASSEYVWIYGEKYRWWDTDNPSVKQENWESVLPGINNALMSITHPGQLAKQHIATKNGTSMNLLQNGDFATTAPNSSLPANWDTWQINEGQGTFALDKSVNRDDANSGAARITGVKEGVFLQSINVIPGEMYAVRAHMRQVGESISSISIRWQDAKGVWLDAIPNVNIYGANADNWQTINSAVTVAAGVGKLVVLLSAQDQVNAKDAVWFDDVGVYKITE